MTVQSFVLPTGLNYPTQRTSYHLPAQLQCLGSRAEEPGNKAIPGSSCLHSWEHGYFIRVFSNSQPNWCNVTVISTKIFQNNIASLPNYFPAWWKSSLGTRLSAIHDQDYEWWTGCVCWTHSLLSSRLSSYSAVMKIMCGANNTMRLTNLSSRYVTLTSHYDYQASLCSRTIVIKLLFAYVH